MQAEEETGRREPLLTWANGYESHRPLTLDSVSLFVSGGVSRTISPPTAGWLSCCTTSPTRAALVAMLEPRCVYHTLAQLIPPKMNDKHGLLACLLLDCGTGRCCSLVVPLLDNNMSCWRPLLLRCDASRCRSLVVSLLDNNMSCWLSLLLRCNASRCRSLVLPLFFLFPLYFFFLFQKKLLSVPSRQSSGPSGVGMPPL